MTSSDVSGCIGKLESSTTSAYRGYFQLTASLRETRTNFRKIRFELEKAVRIFVWHVLKKILHLFKQNPHTCFSVTVDGKNAHRFIYLQFWMRNWCSYGFKLLVITYTLQIWCLGFTFCSPRWEKGWRWRFFYWSIYLKKIFYLPTGYNKNALLVFQWKEKNWKYWNSVDVPNLPNQKNLERIPIFKSLLLFLHLRNFTIFDINPNQVKILLIILSSSNL